MFKKITIAVLGMVASSIVTAGSMGPVCTPGNVTVPCVERLWNFGAQALYLRSVFGSEKAHEFETLPLSNKVENNWNWGFRLEGSYHFNTGNDININWMHYSTSITPGEFRGFLEIPALGIPEIPTEFELNNQNRLDQVNAVLGQYTNISMRDKMRFYAGLQYANIQSTSTNYYSNIFIFPTDEIPTTFSKFDNTDYKGIGAVVGIDYAFYLLESLSLTANGAGSLLYGTNHYHAGFIASPVEAIVSQVFLSKNTIVPSLEAKLGLNYELATRIGIANIQVGYQTVNYFHVLEEQPLQNLEGPIRSVDYGLFGPYFGLKLIGNA